MPRSLEPLPGSMKAVRLRAYDGRPESIRVEDAPVERPGPGQVTIRVAAAPINPSDVMFIRGLSGLPIGRKRKGHGGRFPVCVRR